jgi:hypothetical protein
MLCNSILARIQIKVLALMWPMALCETSQREMLRGRSIGFCPCFQLPVSEMPTTSNLLFVPHPTFLSVPGASNKSS